MLLRSSCCDAATRLHLIAPPHPSSRNQSQWLARAPNVATRYSHAFGFVSCLDLPAFSSASSASTRNKGGSKREEQFYKDLLRARLLKVQLCRAFRALASHLHSSTTSSVCVHWPTCALAHMWARCARVRVKEGDSSAGRAAGEMRHMQDNAAAGEMRHRQDNAAVINVISP